MSLRTVNLGETELELPPPIDEALKQKSAACLNLQINGTKQYTKGTPFENLLVRVERVIALLKREGNLIKQPIVRVFVHLSDSGEQSEAIFIKVKDLSQKAHLYSSICLVKQETYLIYTTPLLCKFKHDDYVARLLMGKDCGRLAGTGEQEMERIQWDRCCAFKSVISMEESIGDHKHADAQVTLNDTTGAISINNPLTSPVSDRGDSDDNLDDDEPALISALRSPLLNKEGES